MIEWKSAMDVKHVEACDGRVQQKRKIKKAMVDVGPAGIANELWGLLCPSPKENFESGFEAF